MLQTCVGVQNDMDGPMRRFSACCHLASTASRDVSGRISSNCFGTQLCLPGHVLARDGYAEAVDERATVWSLKRRSGLEAGREIPAVFANIVERAG